MEKAFQTRDWPDFFDRFFLNTFYVLPASWRRTLPENLIGYLILIEKNFRQHIREWAPESF